MAKEKRNNSDIDQEEFGSDLSPDDLDVREDNNQTNEQLKNSNKEKQRNEKNSSTLNQ